MSQGFAVAIRPRLFTTTGAVGNGWKIQTKVAGTDTDLTTYSNATLTSQNTNPIVCDSQGYYRCYVAAGVLVKMIVYNADDVLQYEDDNLEAMIVAPSPDPASTFSTGMMIPWPDPSNLPGSAGTWLVCDGTAVSRVTYSDLNDLYAACTPAYPYGSGDGSTTFNLPDMRGRFLLAQAASGTGATIGGTGGSLDHTHTGPSHTHTVEVTRDGWGGTQIAGLGPQGRMLANDGTVQNLTDADNDQTFTSAAGGTGNTGGANPAYLVAGCWIVKT